MRHPDRIHERPEQVLEPEERGVRHFDAVFGADRAADCETVLG